MDNQQANNPQCETSSSLTFEGRVVDEDPWELSTCPRVTRDSIRHLLMEDHDKRPVMRQFIPYPPPKLTQRLCNIFHRQAFLFPFLYNGSLD